MTFRIARLDENNWTVEELIPGGLHPITREPGRDKWKVVGYFGRLEHLAVFLLNRQIAVPGGTLETQVKELLTEIKATEQRIVEQLAAATHLQHNSERHSIEYQIPAGEVR